MKYCILVFMVFLIVGCIGTENPQLKTVEIAGVPAIQVSPETALAIDATTEKVDTLGNWLIGTGITGLTAVGAAFVFGAKLLKTRAAKVPVETN